MSRGGRVGLPRQTREHRAAPRHPAPLVASMTFQGGTSKRASSRPPAARRILVVDDDDDVRDAVADLLRDEGFIVDTAENGKVALEVLRQHMAALIFLDLEMPVMDG